ncbi:MAG: hypothetical protein HMLIMOIP_002229 [Candidatus Nitrosomirales archaeon]|jgi:hypothetical protein
MRFTDKVVVVTGASSGIGEQACIDFAKRGAKVALVARSNEKDRRGRSVVQNNA